MYNLTEKIAQANGMEIEKIFHAFRQRYAELFPDWDIIMLSIEKGVDRNEQLDRMIAMLQNMKT